VIDTADRKSCCGAASRPPSPLRTRREAARTSGNQQVVRNYGSAQHRVGRGRSLVAGLWAREFGEGRGHIAL
jgi:hypothetical protein